MTISISQFNVTYETTHDRLILKVLTGNDQEVRLWLTRRYVQALFKVIAEQQKDWVSLNDTQATTLQQIAAKDKEIQTKSSANANNYEAADSGAVTANDRQKPASSTQLSEAYQGSDDTALPYGEEPLLVSRITIQPHGDGKLNLILGEEHVGGLQIDLNLNHELVESLMQLLQEVSNTAQWDLLYQPQPFNANLSRAGARLH